MEVIKLIRIALFVHIITAQTKCEPGNPHRIDCNICQCGTGSTVVACSTMACLSNDTSLESDATSNMICNSCFCNGNSISVVCTEMTCSHTTDLHGNNATIEADFTYTDECNIHICDPDLGYDCTSSKCPKISPRSPNWRVSGVPCTPGTAVGINDYKCFCNENGIVDSCVWKPRPQITEGEGTICEPRTSYKDDCNTCTCDEYGSGYHCTQMNCWSFNVTTSVQNVTYGLCNPGVVYVNECNICLCNLNGSQYFCSVMDCWFENSTTVRQNGSTYVSGSSSQMHPFSNCLWLIVYYWLHYYVLYT